MKRKIFTLVATVAIGAANSVFAMDTLSEEPTSPLTPLIKQTLIIETPLSPEQREAVCKDYIIPYAKGKKEVGTIPWNHKEDLFWPLIKPLETMTYQTEFARKIDLEQAQEIANYVETHFSKGITIWPFINTSEASYTEVETRPSRKFADNPKIREKVIHYNLSVGSSVLWSWKQEIASTLGYCKDDLESFGTIPFAIIEIQEEPAKKLSPENDPNQFLLKKMRLLIHECRFNNTFNENAEKTLELTFNALTFKYMNSEGIVEWSKVLNFPATQDAQSVRFFTKDPL